MQNDQSARRGASGHRGNRAKKDRDVLSPDEAAALDRGQAFKRYIRAAAALNDLYDDTVLAAAVGVGRGAIIGWWNGARPSAPTVLLLARATGLSPDELYRFLYDDGPPPALPEPGSPLVSSVEEGLRQDREHQRREGHDTPAPSLPPQPRGSGAGRG